MNTVKISQTFIAGILLVSAGVARTAFGDLPPVQPSDAQKAQIARKYGMFCHFGINTYSGQEWSDGNLPPGLYAPPADLDQKIDSWVKTAHDAGMRYFLCITKHHDGFCLWDTNDTDYGVNNPAVKVHTDVVRAVSNACRKYGIGFAVYYSLWHRHWDGRHADLYKKDRASANKAYTDYMVKELHELMTQYGPVCELWMDGSWAKKPDEWGFDQVYAEVKRDQPQCQVGVNWNIGLPDKPDTQVGPANQKEGYPIRYFPSDFRLGDPQLPVFPDPKMFVHDGKRYYMPFESTVTVSAGNNWFYHPNDSHAKSVDQLQACFEQATAQDNMLVFNIPPDRDGDLVPAQVASVLGLGPGKPFPKSLKNLCIGASATASATWVNANDPNDYGAHQAIDGNPGTRWACADGVTAATLDVEFGKPVRIDRGDISEYESRVQSFDLERWDGASWTPFSTGTTIGPRIKIPVAEKPMSKLRLNIKNASSPPSIYEFQALVNQ